MSTYEDYGGASKHYDTTRVAVAPEVILGHLVTGRSPLAETHLLDAGCGTGNYAAAVGPHVDSLTIMDASADMLAVASAKLTSIPGIRVAESQVATLQDLPFADASFDAAMTNQVLHHLEDGSDPAWPEHADAFAEYARVLRPGGTLVINTCAPEQVRDGYWFFSLIPQGRDEMARRYVPLDVLEDLAGGAGLEPIGRLVPTDATIQGDAYFDPKNPLSEAFRRSDSTWSLSPQSEIDSMIDTVTGLRDRGELDAYVADHDARRPHIGQTTFLAFRHP